MHTHAEGRRVSGYQMRQLRIYRGRVAFRFFNADYSFEQQVNKVTNCEIFERDAVFDTVVTHVRIRWDSIAILQGSINSYMPRSSIVCVCVCVIQEHADVYAGRAETIEKEMEMKLAKTKASLEESHDRLVGRTADSAKVGSRRRGNKRNIKSQTNGEHSKINQSDERSEVRERRSDCFMVQSRIARR